MSFIRPLNPTNDPFSQWGSSIQTGIKEKSISVSTDFNIQSGPEGSHISLQQENKYTSNYMNYVGEWNPLSSYTINDVVRVLPNKDYYSGWITNMTVTPNPPTVNGTYTIPNTNITINVYPMPYYVPIPGTYVCVANVPSFDTYYQILNSIAFKGHQISGFGGDVSTSTINSLYILQSYLPYIRFIDVNYFPVWPEKTFIAEITPDPTHGNTFYLANGRYWELMSLLPSSARSCINGINTNVFADMQTVPTGSANYTGSV
jgi:hypothetical protein